VTDESEKHGDDHGPKTGELIPQPHGGAIRWGGTNKGGAGRPRDEFRAELREIARSRGVPFLVEVLDGKVPIDFVGTCPKCKAEARRDFDPAYWQRLQAMVQASVDQRLKAIEQMLRYGLGTQTEAVAPEDIKAEANRMLAELCRILMDEEHWPTAKVQRVVERMVEAGQHPQEG